MAVVAIAIGYIILLVYVLTVLILFYIIIKKRKQLFISIPVAIVLVCLLTGVIYFLRNDQQKMDAQPFLGDYQLLSLDGQDCAHCVVRMNDDFQYDILRDGQIVGHGKWWLESAIDIPGKYLQLENGPGGVIWPHIRTIDYINR